MYRYLIILNIILFPNVVFAHPGHDVGGFLVGLMHPFSGLDHMLAMLAVGVWAALSARTIQQIVGVFVAGMLAGGVLGIHMLVPAMLESLLLLTALIAALLVAFAVRLPYKFQLLLSALFALIHGMAHGMEMPQAMPLLPYAGGFVLATAVLLIAGWALAKVLVLQRRQQYLGAGLASVAGLMFFVA